MYARVQGRKFLRETKLNRRWVQTDMGAFAAKSWGAEQAPMTVEESADAVIRLVRSSTLELA